MRDAEELPHRLANIHTLQRTACRFAVDVQAHQRSDDRAIHVCVSSLTVEHDALRPGHQWLDFVIEPVSHACDQSAAASHDEQMGSVFHRDGQVSRCCVSRYPLPTSCPIKKWMEIGVGGLPHMVARNGTAHPAIDDAIGNSLLVRNSQFR